MDIAQHPHIIGHIIGKSKLTDIHSEWIKWIWCAGSDTLAIMAHRGSYKTTAIDLVGTIWWLLFNPSDRVFIIRKTFTDAAKVTSAIAAAF